MDQGKRYHNCTVCSVTSMLLHLCSFRLLVYHILILLVFYNLSATSNNKEATLLLKFGLLLECLVFVFQLWCGSESSTERCWSHKESLLSKSLFCCCCLKKGHYCGLEDNLSMGLCLLPMFLLSTWLYLLQTGNNHSTNHDDNNGSVWGTYCLLASLSGSA